jgi:hypothetical protein
MAFKVLELLACQVFVLLIESLVVFVEILIVILVYVSCYAIYLIKNVLIG